jgi:membrane dipeptidase
MKPQRLLACLFLFSSLALSQHQSQRPLSKKAVKKTGTSRPQPGAALAIHQSALIIDTHADTPQRFLDEIFDLGQNTPVSEGHIDLGKIKKGNLGAEFFSIWVEPEFKGRYASGPASGQNDHGFQRRGHRPRPSAAQVRGTHGH